MRLATALLLALTTATLSGCSALDRVNDSLYATGAFDLEPSSAAAARNCAVTIFAGNRRGRGVVTGKSTILTVAHVVGDARDVEVFTSSTASTHAHVSRRLASAPEDLIELTIDEAPSSFAGFDRERFAREGTGAPSLVIAATGAHSWRFGAALRPGDSGSPVIGDDGALVGLLVGKTRDGQAVMAPLGSTPGSSAVVVARLAAQR